MVKWTLKDSYDNVEYLPLKIRGYLDLFRPFTLVIAFISGFILAVGVAGYNGVTLSHSWRTAIYVATTFSMVTAASNALNQYTDSKEDTISKPYRPIPQGVVTEHEALSLAYILYFVALARAFITDPEFGAVLMIIAIITIIYSLHPIRLKKRFLINNLSLAVARGPLPVISVWYIYGTPNAVAYAFGIALLIYLFAAVSTKDFHDAEADREIGNITLPVVLGEMGAWLAITPFFILPYVIFWSTPTLKPLIWTLPLVLLIITMLIKNRDRTITATEYNMAWGIAYTVLALLYIGYGYIIYQL